ncbi:putative C6 finger domain protein [Aspergillus clavatus NRRL 1]|uniref:C6 finger domain protein, putative n=1 Tax=Aspergillus clavatus (strain ATCC 1007 / CBS 513.65 / DSM 816 / NCTC 3887 / NRRL 1 / QM 1276 / 107) TaxID=344612 RepID=A1CCF2_ASPCL|nr:C6 finger domain protein, putative [Aspergillus clavatus NRRL 1]EAW12209.1 C6 finger domain protein, putative [Aspergillus clavatus NRRL 1]
MTTTKTPSTTVSSSTSKPNPSPAPTQSNPAPKKGKDKKIFSCHSCRRRKLKCDRFDPCGACQARGEGHLCTWEEGQRPERSHRESLEQLPKLILKLTEEVKQLKTSNSALIENIRGKGDSLPESLGLTPGDSRPSSHAATNSICTGWGVDSPCRAAEHKQWTPLRIVALLPESALVWGLISHYIYASASLTGFVDVPQLINDVEEVEQFRQAADYTGSPGFLDQLHLKVALILACASLAAVDLDPQKAQELGLGGTDIDALVRDLGRKSRTLITPVDVDSFTAPNLKSPSAPAAQSSSEPPDFLQQANSPPTPPTDTPLRVVSIKILLLLAARSFAAPSEYLKLHLDVISAAVDASLDGPCDEDTSLAEREWRWQLWSFLCVLDWTSPGIYHNSSYFIRPEMHRDAPSKVPGLTDDGAYPPTIEREHWDRLGQTRHYLEYALALAHLSRRAEDCIIRPGPISPAQAAELCAELDALDSKLSFYQLLTTSPAAPDTAGAGASATDLPTHSAEHRGSLARAPLVQNIHLSLELGLIRFKLFRHEAFHLMHEASSSGPLRMMCMDACMDACILVLSQCRSIGNGDMVADRVSRIMDYAAEEKRPCTGSLRRVLQPASSAALVGQVLLHAAQAGGWGMGGAGSRPASRAGAGGEMAYQAGGRMNQEKVRLLQWHINLVVSLLEALQGTNALARYKVGLHRQCM